MATATRYTTAPLLFLVGLGLAFTACGGESAGAGAESATSEAAPFEGVAQTTQGLSWDLPAAWRPEAPSSSMRLAQAAIPGGGGPGQLSVFHFGVGGGGGVEANLQRWIGQMRTEEQASRHQLEKGELRVTWIELGGTLSASRIGSFPPTDMPDYRLLGAVIEGPGGPWFFRAIGPDATLVEQRDAWIGMLESVRAP